MNLFELPQGPLEHELFEPLVDGAGVLIERIVSSGHVTPQGHWYDQARDEWVVVLQGSAKLAWEDGRTRALSPGDFLLIPAHERHRVMETSSDPPCIWLAVHGRFP